MFSTDYHFNQKIKFSFLILFFLARSISLAQAPSWKWAKSASLKDSNIGKNVCVDDSGNVYATGNFGYPSINFGTVNLVSSSSAGKDIFVVKYNSAGSVLWATSFQGIYNDDANDISCDHFGNIYITGYYSGIQFSLGAVTLTNSGLSFATNWFIAKLNSSGNVIWAKSFSGDNNTYGYNVSNNSIGDVFVTGVSTSSLAIGSVTYATALSGSRIFLLKYNPTGNLIWQNSVGGNIGDYILPNDLTVDANGNSIISGTFKALASTHTATLVFGSHSITNSPTQDAIMFIAKYNASGNAVWAKSSSGTASVINSFVSTDNSGNVFVTGAYQKSVSTLPSGILNFGTVTISYTGAGNKFFILKYNNQGNELWANSYGGNSQYLSNGISCDKFDNVFIAGVYSGSSFSVGSINLPNSNNNSDDIFILKFNNSGNSIWAKTAGSEGVDLPNSICNDVAGNVYITGYYRSSSVSFDGNIINNIVATPSLNPLAMVFVARLGTKDSVAVSNVGFTTLIKDKVEATIYPNPSCDIIKIITNPNLNFNLEITNVLGELIFEKSNLNDIESVNLTSFENGIYFLKLESQGESRTFKILKE